MNPQRLSIRGRILEADDPSVRDTLAAVYEAPERPRCMCVPGGVEICVAFHRRCLAKRMPDPQQPAPICGECAPCKRHEGMRGVPGDRHPYRERQQSIASPTGCKSVDVP